MFYNRRSLKVLNKKGIVINSTFVDTMCDVCGRKKEKIYLGNYKVQVLKNNGQYLCRNCSYKRAYAIGNKTSIFSEMNKNNKDKRLEEIYGDEKAKMIRAIRSFLSSGKNNPMYGKKATKLAERNRSNKGKTLEDIYSVQKATEMKQKMSTNASGVNNPMYGKPSPHGAGNGWKGWYKGIFFRSLLELSFIVNFLERYKFKYENAEKLKYTIKYQDYTGAERTYRADFVIDNRAIVEIKPYRLMGTPLVEAKRKAAAEWCKNNNYTYFLFSSSELERLSSFEIRGFHNRGLLHFTDRYEELYKKTYANKE